MKSFFIALQFLTCVPIRLRESPSKEDTGKSLLAYPLVGVFIGLVISAIYLLLPDDNNILRGAVVLTAWVFITGALHLDGLADSADALVGGFGNKDKTLAIMKDPYCGPVGVVTLVLVLLLKFSVLVSLPSNGAILLLLAPVIARASVLWSFLNIPYVRKNGLGAAFSEGVSKKNTRLTLILCALLIVIFSHWLGLALLLSSLLILYMLKRVSMKRIDGMTGDTLGAQIEIIETSTLLIGAILITKGL